VLWTVAKEHGLVAPLCVVVGIGACLHIAYWLLGEEIDKLCARRLARGAEPAG
jgi:hypothetical protein